jgi:hypothetical protein
MMDEEDEDEGGLVIVCQGPPRCALEGDEAVAAQKAGRVWCTRIYVTAFTEDVIQEPGNA